MNIQDIMDSLGIEGPMTPEKAKAIKDAVQAILQSRQPIPPGGGGGGGGNRLPGGDIELSVDPNLLRPSQKHNPQGGSNDDLEVEDPDDVLSKVKQNNPNENESEEDPNQEDDEDKKNNSEEQGENQKGNNNPDQDSNSNNNSNNGENENSGEPKNNKDTNEVNNDSEEENDFDEDDFDDKPVLDDPEKSNNETDKKRQNRDLTKSRTISLGKQALAKAGEAPENKSKADNLRKAIEELENLTDEDLDNMSDETFSQKINKVIDSVSAIDPKTYVTDAETMAKKVQEIKKGFNNPDLINELNQEDAQIVGNERRAVKASEREKTKYTAGNFKSVADFKINFYKAIKDQVEEIEQEMQS